MGRASEIIRKAEVKKKKEPLKIVEIHVPKKTVLGRVKNFLKAIFE